MDYLYSDEDYYNSNGKRELSNSDIEIKLNNYNWKSLYGIMNRIKNIWYIKNFNHALLSEFKQLNNLIYSNLYQCNCISELRPKNNILKNDINSLFQNILFDFLYEEQDLYEFYDKQFSNKNYTSRNSNLPFKSFIIYFKNLYLDINSNKQKLDNFKKIRWYIFYENKNILNKKNDLFKSSIIMMDIEENEDNNYEYNNYFKKDINEDNYNKLNLNSNNNDLNDYEIDNINEKDENIINNEIIDDLILNEDNPLLYIIKIIYLSIVSFCKETICYLLTTYSDNNILLINNYLKRFDNFVECSKLINSKCENINVAINYLYKSLFEEYPNYPKFSIFRLCIKIWYKESTSFLIQNSNITLLNKIKNSIIDLYSNMIKDDIILIQNSSFISNSKNDYFNQKEKLSLSSSISIFNSENINNKISNFNFTPFGSLYDENNSKYYIIEKGLQIIYDSFSNEFNVNLLNLSNIDVNNYYNEIEISFLNIIKENIIKSFELNVKEKNISIKIFIKKLLTIFKDYFYEKRIIPKLKDKIFNLIYILLKESISNYFIYLFNKKNKNIKETNNENIYISNSKESQNTNYSSYLENNFSINNIEHKYDSKDYINEISKYIIKENNIDENNGEAKNTIYSYINEIYTNEKIEELVNNIEDWKNDSIYNILKTDKKVKKELNKKNLTNKYNYIQRQLYSYSIESDWNFIEKVNLLEKDNITANKFSIFDIFDDFNSFNDSNNLAPFYNELINNNFKSNEENNKRKKENNDYKDINIGKSFFNLDLNNNFFMDNKNDEDINPFNPVNENTFNNLDYKNNLNNLNNLDNIYSSFNYFGTNNYNLNDLNPFNDFNKK